jgi:flagellar hook-basal body complex protein FliE
LQEVIVTSEVTYVYRSHQFQYEYHRYSVSEAQLGKAGKRGRGPGFSGVQNVEATEAVTQEDAYNLSIGNMDDMHTLMINAAKADVALQTMVQLRNKFLEAYSEIMRTNL